MGRRHSCHQGRVTNCEVADSVRNGQRDEVELRRDLIGHLGQHPGRTGVTLIREADHFAPMIVVAHIAAERHHGPGPIVGHHAFESGNPDGNLRDLDQPNLRHRSIIGPWPSGGPPNGRSSHGGAHARGA